MKKYFIELFEFECWANKRILDYFKINNILDDKFFYLFSHILATQRIWFNRINKLDTQINSWRKQNFEDCIKAFNHNSNSWKRLIKEIGEEDFESNITYCNGKGSELNSTLQDILTHMVNHSSYHRGQIILMINQKASQFPVLDYIVFKRNQRHKVEL